MLLTRLIPVGRRSWQQWCAPLALLCLGGLLLGGDRAVVAQGTQRRPGPQTTFGEGLPAEFRAPPPQENQPPAAPAAPLELALPANLDPQQLTTPQGVSSTLNLMILLTVLSLAPSILMMTTCFVRFVIVFGLLRQALGTQQLPPNQVMVSLSLFLTCMVMAPVWQESYDQGIRPYTAPAPGEPRPTLDEMFVLAVRPVRYFMADQIERAGNAETLWMFIDYQRPDPESIAGLTYRDPENYDEIPLTSLLPAYMLSELKTAFIIGFQLYLPFVVVDMVVSAVLISMGMMMLPPVLISLPFKLLLFVLIDGWTLTVGMLLTSVRPLG